MARRYFKAFILQQFQELITWNWPSVKSDIDPMLTALYWSVMNVKMLRSTRFNFVRYVISTAGCDAEANISFSGIFNINYSKNMEQFVCIEEHKYYQALILILNLYLNKWIRKKNIIIITWRHILCYICYVPYYQPCLFVC